MRCIMHVAFVFSFSALYAHSVALKITTHNAVERQTQRPIYGDISHDEAEWEAFTRTLHAPTIVRSSGKKLCLLGHAVPEFFLLGSQKSGTTTFASDAAKSGFKSAIGMIKELHSFDHHCHFHTRGERPNNEWMSNGAPIDVCQKMTDSEKELWANKFARCASSPSTALTDFTPANLRIPGLPEVMADLYGENRSRLTFAILLREPLSRFQSGWYQLGGKSSFNTTFKEHVDSVLSMAENMDHQSIGQDYFLDEFFRSLYSNSMKHWLDEFKPAQFIIIPSILYFKNATFRSRLLQHIGHKMGMEVDTTAVETRGLGHNNKGEHPPLSEDLDSSQIDTLRAQYYNPANSELFQMLAEAIPNGLELYGFEGRSTPSEIEDFLISSW